MTEQQRLREGTEAAEQAASTAEAAAQAVRKERDQSLKAAKAEATRKERDMLASHTSEVVPPAHALLAWLPRQQHLTARVLQASQLRDELASLKQEHSRLSTDFEQVSCTASARVALQQPQLLTPAICTQTRASKVAALMRASQAEDTALQAFEEMGSMKDTLSDLKDRLAQVRNLIT